MVRASPKVVGRASHGEHLRVAELPIARSSRDPPIVAADFDGDAVVKSAGWRTHHALLRAGATEYVLSGQSLAALPLDLPASSMGTGSRRASRLPTGRRAGSGTRACETVAGAGAAPSR